jgi:hypothetical protein
MPLPEVFTCPRCGCHWFATSCTTPGKTVRYCKGPVVDGVAMRTCTFEWSGDEDHRYLAPAGTAG